MKLPQAFIPNKKSGKDIDRLMKKPKKKKNIFVLDDLLESYQEFSKSTNRGLEYCYILSKDMADDIDYKKKDLEELNKRTKSYDPLFGVYFSNFANKVLDWTDTITFYFERDMDFLGMNMQKGFMLINGSTHFNTGINMQGGTIIITGNSGMYTGNCMKNGRILVQGNVGTRTGHFMKDGKINAFGDIEDIALNCQGHIYKKNKLIWPKS